jgi:hypothetical protein
MNETMTETSNLQFVHPGKKCPRLQAFLGLK